MADPSQWNAWLPIVFLGLMGIGILVYVVLDGYDLGVGMMLASASDAERDRMVSAIAPFWDANETWLVLGIGILLTAFPRAHGYILGQLYLPVALMLAGLILRGVAFDFRVKAKDSHKRAWDAALYAGSFLAAICQGLMLGRYVLGFQDGVLAWLFAAFVGVTLAAGYALLGSGWLILKTEGALQRRAARWGGINLWLTAAGIAAISIATPLVSSTIFQRWFSFPSVVLLMPIPLVTAGLFGVVALALRRVAGNAEPWAWVPFAGTVGIFLLAFFGLAFSTIPYVVVDRMTAWEAAAAPESLVVILAGALAVLPFIAAYTAYSYWVFRGKARDLSY